MPLSLEEAALYLALNERHVRNADVALAVRNNGRVDAVGIDDANTPQDSRSAIINLLQNSRVRGFIATSYAPIERCLGMAAMQGVNLIVALCPNGVRHFTNAGGAWVNAPAPPAPPGGWPNVIPMPDIPGLYAAAPLARGPLLANWLLMNNPLPVAAFRLVDTYRNAPRHRRFASPDLAIPDDAHADNGVRADNAGRHQLFMNMAWAFVAAGHTEDRFAGYAGGHNIGSVLRGPADQILGWGLNSGGILSTLHGEVNLIQNYHRRQNGAAIPQHSWLYTTLEPCHMCAAMFADSGMNLRCYFGQADPGIQNNALARVHNGNTQQHLATVLGGALHVQYIAAGAGPITQFLAGDEAWGSIMDAIDLYFAALPPPGTHDRVIWEAGLSILYQINPNIRMAWGFHPNYYGGVI